MSKTIDTSEGYEALTDDEVAYLAQKDDEYAIAEAQNRGLHPGGEPKDWETHPYFGDANTKGRTVAQVDRMTAESPHHEDVDEDDDDLDDEDDDEVDDDEVVDYNEWQREDLLGELKLRGLPLTGNKPELIKRLEEDDAKED